MNVIIRPEFLRHLCKEPLDEVESIRLRGRGIVRLIGLDACPKLVSLDVSRNTLTDLGETGIEECRSLWILDVSHNSLVGWVIILHSQWSMIFFCTPFCSGCRMLFFWVIL